MSPSQTVTWSDAAQKFLVPLLLAVTSTSGAMMVSELQSLRKEMQEVKIEMTRLQVKMEILSTRPAGT